MLYDGKKVGRPRRKLRYEICVVRFTGDLGYYRLRNGKRGWFIDNQERWKSFATYQGGIKTFHKAKVKACHLFNQLLKHDPDPCVEISRIRYMKQYGEKMREVFYYGRPDESSL